MYAQRHTASLSLCLILLNKQTQNNPHPQQTNKKTQTFLGTEDDMIIF